MNVRSCLRPTLFGAALVLLAGVAPAQKLLHAANDGWDFKGTVSMGGPNLLLGIKFTAPAPLPVIAAEVFTGKRTGLNTLAIWDHVPATNMPGQELAIGSWNMWNEPSWQGAVFNQPVILTANQEYWLVWGCQNGSQASQPNTGTQSFIYRGSFDAGLNWNGGVNGWGPIPWKFRLYHPSRSGSFTQVGSGVPGAGLFTPKLDATGWPVHGNEITLRLIDPAPNVPALLLGGLPATVPAWPWTIYTLPIMMNIGLTTGAGRGAGDGHLPIPLPIPDDPVLSGFRISLQAWIVDPAGPAGVAHTNGLTVLIM